MLHVAVKLALSIIINNSYYSSYKTFLFFQGGLRTTTHLGIEQGQDLFGN